jgi:histone H3/H4
MEATSDTFWKKCSSCKKPIGFGAKYYICSVSTCNGLRTGYVFCSMACFEVHLPGARHRDAGGIQKIAPSQIEAAKVNLQENSGFGSPAPVRRKIVTSDGGGSIFTPAVSRVPRDILIVASKLKEYINAKADMNTSANVMEVLSDIVRRACDDAIDQARQEGRKTVMDRDFKN